MKKEEAASDRASDRNAARMSTEANPPNAQENFSQLEETWQYPGGDRAFEEFAISVTTAMHFGRLPVKMLVYIPFLLLCYYYLHPSGLGLTTGVQAILQGITAALLSDIVLEAARKTPRGDFREGVSKFMIWAMMATLVIGAELLLFGSKSFAQFVQSFIFVFALLAIANRLVLFMLVTMWMLSKLYPLLQVNDDTYPYFVLVLLGLVSIFCWLGMSIALFQRRWFGDPGFLFFRIITAGVLTLWIARIFHSSVYAGQVKQIYMTGVLLFIFSILAWIIFAIIFKKHNPIWERILVMLGTGGAIFTLQFAV